MSDKQKTIRGAWLTVGLLFVVAALNYLDRTMITTMRSSVLEAIPMTDAQFGLLTSVFLWIYGLLSPFAGFVADRFDRKRVILSSLFVWSAVTWLTAHASTFNELLLTRALMGISEAFYIPAALAAIADFHGSSTRSLATGIHQAGIMAGQSLGFVGGMVAEQYDWTTAFSALGIFGMMYAVMLVFFLKNPPAVDNDPQTKSDVRMGKGLRDMFRTPGFLRALGYWSLLGIVSWLVMGWLPTYYKDRFSLSQTEAGLFATAWLYPLSFLGVIFGGILADRWSRKNPKGRIMLPALGLLVGAPFIFMATLGGPLPLVVVFFGVYAFTRAFGDANMMPILCLIVDDRYRATAYGIFNFFSTIIGGIAIYAGGILRDAKIDLSYIYRAAAVIMVLCAVLLLGVRKGISISETKS
jgi:MFS family permease